MQWLLDRFATVPERYAFIHRGRTITYGEVVARSCEFRALLDEKGIGRSDIVTILGDYSPETFCLILALALNGNVAIPLSREAVIERDAALAISGCDWLAEFDEEARETTIAPHPIAAENPLLDKLRDKGRPGLILFSSGSTGKPKAILHDLERVIEKFRKQRASVVAIPFLMIDHFGGINTILAITSSLGTVVTVGDRSVSSICRAVQDYEVELLPATPSFLTMLMASNAPAEFNLSSLKRITYGTEVMPQVTLDRLRAAFPGVTLQQTYGLSEVGVLRSKSRDDGSLWVQIGGEGFATKIKDGTLWIKSDYAMLGYLNAPAEFDEEGWFNTQDTVEVDGEWFRILGRATDLINVGGQKVYPAEVEDAVLEISNVEDVAVSGEPHPLLGQIVVAKIRIREPEDLPSLKQRVRAHCRAKLAAYKVPAKVVVSEEPLYTSRQKKRRRTQ